MFGSCKTKRSEVTQKGEKLTNIDEIRKKQSLRNNEYYKTQKVFDKLYSQSSNNKIFKDLMVHITSEKNIRLAYRNIKSNTGSKTAGTDGLTISDFQELYVNNYVEHIKNRLNFYEPHEVLRVHIPKGNTCKTRPLGIPTMSDRLVQQCIKQVLEPICEAKFYNHSYGFRPNRSTKHAISRMMSLMNRSKLHYCVDIDIKGFFDNVNHTKLIKQMWTLGIRDKNLICIISKMLKAPIGGEGTPTKGTPQGGILSPLLSNIVLNELDWWIANQWEYKTTKHDYTSYNKYRALKKTNLKEMFIVRYADDFKVFCRTRKHAKKIFVAIKQWLKERLGLEINEEKSKIVNLRKQYSEFLGIKAKVREKSKKFVTISHITDKSKKKIMDNLRTQLKILKKSPTIKQVNKYNSMILGYHNYYSMATQVNIDFNRIGYNLLKTLHNRTKRISSYNGKNSETYLKYYGDYNYRTRYISGIALFPIAGIKTKPPMNFSQEICDYTLRGRIKIHTNLTTVNIHIIRHIMANPIPKESTEYNDNRISLYSGQGGLCRITEIPLNIGSMETHHILPKNKGGSDAYQNLIYIHEYAHRLIHCTKMETFKKYFQALLEETIRNNIDEYRGNKEKTAILVERLIERVVKYRIRAENLILN